MNVEFIVTRSVLNSGIASVAMIYNVHYVENRLMFIYKLYKLLLLILLIISAEN